MLVGQEIDIPYALLIAVVGFLTVVCILAVIAVLIIVISKIFEAVQKVAGKKKPAVEAAPAPTVVEAKSSGAPLPATESQGELKLQNVDEPTAAVIMAIVSNQSGIELNRLLFKSIKLVEEK